MNNSNAPFSLRLPGHIKQGVARVAKRDGTSVNQFIAVAVAEKLAVLETAEYFAEKAKKANIPEFLAILNRQGGEPPRPDDVLPDE
jgi:uncharacterized protein (DUF1778 family)